MLSPEDFMRLVRKVVVQVLNDRTSNNEILYSDFKQGRIDPGYAGGRPSILFEGEETPSGKQYPYLSSYTPTANDIVILARVAGSYVVLGKKI